MVHMRTDIGATNSHATSNTDTYDDNLDIDVLIVGAGFGGVYLLHRFRDELGLKCKVYEAGQELGGIWHWNCYPGARVDTQVPIYEYSLEKVWKVCRDRIQRVAPSSTILTNLIGLDLVRKVSWIQGAS